MPRPINVRTFPFIAVAEYECLPMELVLLPVTDDDSKVTWADADTTAICLTVLIDFTLVKVSTAVIFPLLEGSFRSNIIIGGWQEVCQIPCLLNVDIIKGPEGPLDIYHV